MAVDLGNIEITKRFGGNMVDQNYINQMLAKKSVMEQARSQRQSSEPDFSVPGVSSNPIRRGIGTFFMGVGEGLTGRPFLTNFNNNLYEQKQAQLKYKQWQEEQRIKAQEDNMQNQLRQSQIDLNKKMASGMSSDATEAGFELPKGENPEDYRVGLKPVTYRGITRIVSVPERKKDLSQAEATALSEVKSTVNDLNKNLNTLKEKAIKSGFGYEATGLPGADLYSQYVKGKDYSTWKADTGRAFQKYRKWATGVAAGYPELQLLAPNFPKVSDKPDVYEAKTKSAIEDMNKNYQALVDHLSKAGYAVSKFKGVTKQDESDFSSMSDDELKKIIAGGK